MQNTRMKMMTRLFRIIGSLKDRMLTAHVFRLKIKHVHKMSLSNFRVLDYTMLLFCFFAFFLSIAWFHDFK